MDILQINRFFRLRGGADRYFLELSRLLEARGHNVLHMSTSHAANESSPYAGYFVPGFSEDDYLEAGARAKIRAFINGIYSYPARRAVCRLVSQHHTDIAHAHNVFYQLSPSVFVGLKQRGVPTVMSLLDSSIICAAASLHVRDAPCERCRSGLRHIVRLRCYRSHLGASVMAYLAKKAHRALDIWKDVDLFFTASSNFRDLLVNWGFDGARIRVNPYFTDFVDLDPSYEDQGYALVAGRISFNKGIGTLLRAFEKINYPIVIAGDGPERSWAEEYVRAHGLQHVRFVGFVQSKAELENWIRGCRFMIVPSELYEIYPLVAIEAMSLGKPVVGADVGGIPELVQHLHTGLLFARADHRDLEAKIKLLVRDNALVKHLGSNARVRAVTEFRADSHYERLMAGYRAVLGSAA